MKKRFTASRWADYAYELASLNAEGDVFYRLGLAAETVIIKADIFGFNYGLQY